jgi:hypothetical protein
VEYESEGDRTIKERYRALSPSYFFKYLANGQGDEARIGDGYVNARKKENH